MSQDERIAAVRERVKSAEAEFYASRQAQEDLLIELVGDRDHVPAGLAEGLGLDLRTASSILRRRRGQARPAKGPRRVFDSERKMWVVQGVDSPQD